MPIIAVTMFPGRTPEQKRKLAKSLTEAFVAVSSIEPEGVQVIFTEVQQSDWSVAGRLYADRRDEP